MGYRGVGLGVRLIGSDYPSVQLAIASQMVFREVLALIIDDNCILVDDENVEYYCIVDKYGLNTMAGSAINVLFGPLAWATASTAAGSGLVDGVHKLVFIKLKNGNRVLIQVEEMYMHMIKSHNKISKKKMSEENLEWIRYWLDLYYSR